MSDESLIQRASTPMLLTAVVVSAALLLFGDNYLLFHTFAELFTASVALVVFSIAWHTRRLGASHYLTFVGMSALPIAIVTILHTLAYKGMPVFPGRDVDLPTQLWLVARVIQASAFLIAPLFLTRRLRQPGLALAIYGTVAFVLVVMAFAGLLPPALIEGKGLTPFKIAVEYVVIGATALGVAWLGFEGEHLDWHPRLLLSGSMAATILAELAFTLYTDPYGPFNRLGHALHITAFLLIYLALAQASLEKPLSTLFLRLKQRERELAVAYEGEHSIAETLQNAMAANPQTIEGIDASHHYLPAPGPGRIGGDFYDLFRITEGCVGFAIGDVCGKGIRAASTAVKTRSALRALALSHDDPSVVLEHLNTYLLDELEEGSFVTAVYGTIDTETGLCRMVIAGHPDPTVCGRASLVPPSTSRSHPLGVLTPLRVTTWEIGLRPGETLVLVTDGLVDAPGESERFGMERLHALLHDPRCWETAEAVAADVIRVLRTHSRERLDDDVAIVALRLMPRSAEALP